MSERRLPSLSPCRSPALTTTSSWRVGTARRCFARDDPICASHTGRVNRQQFAAEIEALLSTGAN